MPVPLIGDILEELEGSKYFSCLDLHSGFHQVLMDEESKKYTALVTKNGLFQMVKMGQGLSATF